MVGYVSKLNPTANAILWTNNFNNFAESAAAIAVDSSGNAWVTGTTSSTAYPNQGWTTGPEFLAGFNAAGKRHTRAPSRGRERDFQPVADRFKCHLCSRKSGRPKIRATGDRRSAKERF